MVPRHSEMATLVECYLRQESGGPKNNLFGPLYFSSPYVQKGHSIGSFLASPFRAVKQLAFRGAWALGREALNTGGPRPCGYRIEATSDKFQEYRCLWSGQFGAETSGQN